MGENAWVGAPAGEESIELGYLIGFCALHGMLRPP